MSFSEACKEMLEWMRLYAGEHPLMLILAADALILLLLANKSIRKMIGIPLLVMVPVVINPILYKYLYKDLRYWRFFWILPEAVLIGLAFAEISRKAGKQWVKCVGLVLVAGTLILAGTNPFSPDARIPRPLKKAENLYKINQYVKENCDIILADDPNPRCIFQGGFTQTRQYSSDIKQLYGRDVDGYYMLPSEAGMRVYAAWNGEPEEQEYIFSYAEENDYTHICCETTEGFNEMAAAHGFSILSETEEYTIYHKAKQ